MQLKHKRQILIIGVNSGIGKSLALRYANDDTIVTGTYRSEPSNAIKSIDNIDLHKLDIVDSISMDNFLGYLYNKKYAWDVVIFSVGTLEPIGNFFDLNFSQWQRSFSSNFFGQLQLMHSVRKFAKLDSTVIFFSGGSPSGVSPCFSSYNVAKIGLIKMVEYLDAEDNKVKYTIVGPGWVDTKIHQKTIKAGNNAGSGLDRTKFFLENTGHSTSVDEIYRCIEWVATKSKKIVGGRNFSVVYDSWGSKEGSNDLEVNLMSDNALFKIQRFS